MAKFNPVPLLHNPRFAVDFVIRRRTTTINQWGEGVTTPQNIAATGVIVPSGNLGMERTPDVTQVGDGIMVYTTTPIATGNADENVAADIIVWHNQEWLVQSQDDWTDFGFNVVFATLLEPGGRNAS